VLSDDVDSEDEDGQRRFKRQKLRELYAGLHNRRALVEKVLATTFVGGAPFSTNASTIFFT
jgi:hypothetical protein